MSPSQIVTALSRPLPGPDAHLLVSHPARQLGVPDGVTPREAGVLLLLYPDGYGALHFPLIERASRHAADRHRGQIALPGGKREPEDDSITATALREAEEEVGVVREDVRVLGQLSPLYIPVSNFLVTATVGFAERRPDFVPQEAEVARVIEASAAELFEERAVRHADMDVHGRLTLKQVPYFALAGERVWGATAMMLSEFRAALSVE